jgi:glyoxylase-like metal-dependent hydrolase (beta-lactamase superfamily II)
MGCRLIADAFPQATLWMHEESLDLYQQVNDYAMLMGFSKIADIPQPDGYLKDADVRKLGELTLQILHTPGHAPGSICIYCPEAEIVFTGDVLFKDSIGRTDLQGGSFDVLQDMIQTKLFTLPQQTVVLPGHGDQTTIGYEQQYNPFLRSTH